MKYDTEEKKSNWSFGLTSDEVFRVKSAFDENYYLENYQDVRDAGFDPLGHYFASGWREMRDPSAEFCTKDYIEDNPDIIVNRNNPFVHWVLIGKAEGRRGRRYVSEHIMGDDHQKPSMEGSSLTNNMRELFDEQYYLANNEDVREANYDPFGHYLETGWKEGRDPSPDFSTSTYMENHSEWVTLGNPFTHWVLVGREKGYPGKAETSAVMESIQFEPNGELLHPSDIQQLKNSFDADYYMCHNSDVHEQSLEPFVHFMSGGWREGRDPSAKFSVRHYLRTYKDIARADINPFVHYVLHGINEARRPLPFRETIRALGTDATISAVIPNYNHGAFLRQRIDSILNQSHPVQEIIILDDCSTDDSVDVILEYVRQYPDLVRFVPNETNSGGVFKQWQKAFALSKSDVIWICESDDYCDREFVSNLIHYFKDNSVNIAFGRILETDRDGVPHDYLDQWRENAEPGIWTQPLVRPAAKWFANALGIANVIANVGGCLMRRIQIKEAIWQEAANFRVVGDWFIYLNIAQGGQIAWDPSAVSYFRRHGSNTSSVSIKQPYFYEEVERFMLRLRETWDLPAATVNQFHRDMAGQYKWLDNFDTLGPFEQWCNYFKLHGRQRHRHHILMTFYGFIPGGGESFPIMLANALQEKGYIVSMLGFEFREVNEDMRRALHPAIAVYDSAWVEEYGADNFLRDAGIKLVHSHTIGSEFHFFEHWKISEKVSYLVTLHGSYEASELPDDRVVALASRVDHFVYTAEKNLLALKPANVPASHLTKFPNAMPVDERPFPKSKSDLGIPQNAIVFTFVARGIKSKGWQQIIEAFCLLRANNSGQRVHLLLVGDGEEPDRLLETYGSDPEISFLGYQACIHGLYRMSDVAVVPSRFSGESYPLCIIQALQCGLPIIGTRVGEIPAMIMPDEDRTAGIIIEPLDDDTDFVNVLAEALNAMLTDELRSKFGKNARALGSMYDMGNLADQYSQLYNDMLIERFYVF